MTFDNILDTIIKNYKNGLLFSSIVLLSVLLFLGNQQITTGFIVPQGIDFTGGTQAMVEITGTINIDALKQNLETATDSRIIIKQLKDTNTITIESKIPITKELLKTAISESGAEYKSSSIHTLGASLGAAFFTEALKAILIAYIFMSIIVFFLFRSFVPSFAIIFASFADITTAIVGMNLLGLNLSMATIAGLLILIGYSIDTDILLSTRVLKRRSEGTVDERIKSSMKTGLTMSITSIIAMIVLYLISTSIILDEIALVIIMGLTADIFYTWFQNVGILKLYAEKKKL
ncbi:protein translocase subunit SecF [archaeon]|nr:protein translocase subunit SecF [archaeon]